MNRHENIDPSAGWLDRLCHLNAATTAQRGRAPHKPLLLLCVLDMVEDGALPSPWLPYSPELLFRFQFNSATASPAP
jgi:putative restriction endonuclease